MASSKNRQASSPLPPPAVLTMGFSPAAAVATWRLAESQAFHCYTYWPVQEVTFQSEEFGSDMVFRTNHFDLNNPPQLLPGQSIAAVILVIPTIKDVARMCKKLKPVISKSTLVLVDTSGGMAPVQRLVKSNLGSSYQVSGMIGDIDAEFLSKKNQDWSILHRKAPTVSSATSSSSPIITLEPCNPLVKTLLSLEDAWTKSGLTAVHLKSATVYAEFQWQRCISVVVFEVLTVVLNIPQPENIAQSLVAKPLVQGLISELTMVAAASGVKGLPSLSQMLTKGPKLARRAPRSFKDPTYSRTYYEVYSNLPVSLDFLVLLPILISDELPKGGATPYLECVYAFMNQLLQLISGESTSPLLERVGSNGSASIDPQVIAALDAREKEIQQREEEFAKNKQDRELDLDRSMKQIQSQQQQLYEQQQLLQNERQQFNTQQEQLQQRQSQLDSQRRQLEQQQRQQQQQQQQQQVNGTQDNLAERLDKLRLREEQLNERDRSFKQREQELYMRENKLQSQYMQNGSTPAMNGTAFRDGTAVTTAPVSPPAVTAQAPTTPGGTVYSRFDPRAPEVAQQQPQQSLPQQLQPQVQQLPQQLQVMEGQPAYITTDSNQPYGSQDTSYSSIESRPRASVGSVYYGGAIPQSGSRSQVMSPQPANAPYLNSPGLIPGQQPGYMQPGYQQVPAQYRRRASRRASLGDEAELASLNGRRRNQSIPNTQSAIFSQNFQLDSVMGSTTDRYHFVSRGRAKQRDPKLSSDEDAYHASRKYIHGGGSSGNYGTLSNTATPSVSELNTLRKSSVPRTRSSVGNVRTAPIPSVQTQLGPTGGQRADYSGFNFENPADSVDPLDSAHPAPPTLDPVARSNGYGASGLPGSNNSSSMESNNASDRSETRTPPTPQGTLDPLKKQNPTEVSVAPTGDDELDKGSGKTWSKRLFRFG